MRNLTRTEIARLIQGKLLNGDKLSSKQFDRVLQKHGNHERSRVLELLRCQWGLPIKEDRKGCYGIPERDLMRFYADPEDTLAGWKAEADQNRKYRKLNRFLSMLWDLRGDISHAAREEVLAAVSARI
ncbi:hypothetical protein QP249_13530 [Klebsiella pneumoniae]|uniref:hypothetical protein n=1 Tax=Klebsiella quasipneumoniae TaxID=1463165 RepID=UPI0010911AC3|nr:MULTISPECIES: hypothetical protein [Klebsiella]MDK6676180.1 hypothetical protein [Klebsiella pneumoniae]MDK8103743.1 hypothetical protein [Klebsiella pneumoniae]VGG68060.1 Uncharacterised protein [Klebsiella quasipneumoniae]HBW2199046.1 hypothetical protein [Klebsiella pneumoniae]HBX7576062.1 hypothetical protein [Klebsiella pneumoniae]